MKSSAGSGPLQGWQVLVLRPARESAALRKAVGALGGRLHCVAPWRIRPLAAQAEQLRSALDAALWVVTSPNAVRCAAAMQPLARFAGLALAVGPGTASALRRAGVIRVDHPADRHDSEGLLDMPALQQARALVLLTGEGGRGLLGRSLAERGTQVERVEVYRREPTRWGEAKLRGIAALASPRALLLGSVEALASGGQPLASALRGFAVVAASQRVARAAADAGLDVVAVAASAAPTALLAALQQHAKHSPIR